ncbi:MAG: prolipoprotein diacylglyceryl transferase family protein [Pseudomonadota bacterium]
MYPVLLSFGDHAASSWHVLLVLAMALSCGLAFWLRDRIDLSRRRLGLFCALAAVFGVLGAKLGHCLLEAPGHLLDDGRVTTGVGDLLAADPWHWTHLLDGGYVWYPGLLLAALGVVLLARALRQPLWPLADLLVLVLPFGMATGRLGCFLAGCCHGAATDLPWAVSFGAGPGAGLGPVHPTQLYEAVLDLGLGVTLLLQRRGLAHAGLSSARFLVLSGGIRFALEFWRGDLERGVWFDGLFSSSQALALLSMVAGGVLLWYVSPSRDARTRTRPDIAQEVAAR